MAISIINHIANYNIVFIKIFQWVWIKNNSDQLGFITDEIIELINKFTTNTPFVESDIDYEKILLIYKIANENGDKFEIDNIEPVNSGTISLIFKGKLNGNYVAIKLLRKNIKEKIESGLNLLISFENIISKLFIINRYYNCKIFADNKHNILNQLDFVKECENIKLFYENFKKNKNVIIPNTYQVYTNLIKNLILMDWIEGKYLYELNNEEFIKYFTPFTKYINKSIFDKNIFHCDLHQGNILFINEIINNKPIYKIGIIDFGMVNRLTIDDVNFIYMLLNAIFNKKFFQFINYLKIENNCKYIFENTNNIELCIEEIINLHNQNLFFNEPKTIIIINNILTFLNILKKYNRSVNSNINYWLLSFIPILTITSKLGSEFSKSEIMGKYLLNITEFDIE